MTDGRIVVVPGQVIASDHMNAVSGQTVMRFASPAARDAALPVGDRADGMLAWTADTGQLWVASTGAWVPRAAAYGSAAPASNYVMTGTPTAIVTHSIPTAPYTRVLITTAMIRRDRPSTTGDSTLTIDLGGTAIGVGYLEKAASTAAGNISAAIVGIPTVLPANVAPAALTLLASGVGTIVNGHTRLNWCTAPV